MWFLRLVRSSRNTQYYYYGRGGTMVWVRDYISQTSFYQFRRCIDPFISGATLVNINVRRNTRTAGTIWKIISHLNDSYYNGPRMALKLFDSLNLHRTNNLVGLKNVIKVLNYRAINGQESVQWICLVI